MRVGIISLAHESNTFATKPTTLEDFRASRLLIGSAARANTQWGNHEVGGFVDGLTREKIEPVPIFIAWALPGGTITAETYRALLDSMLGALADAGPLDGLLVAPHGAGVSEEARDLDGHWLHAVRSQVGDKMPIIGTLDPHANLSAAMVEATDALTAYRTNPHVDQRDRGLEAASLMARTLRGEIRPVQAAALPPVVINIERQHTNEPPCTLLQATAREIGSRKGMLSTSVILGFPYADVAEMGSAVIAVTDGDANLAAAAAEDLGGAIWKNRHDFVGKLTGPAEAVELAKNMTAPVCLLDMGDNVGGGAPGDGTVLAHLLNRPGVGKSFFCLYDPPSANRAMEAGIGASLTLAMGGNSGAVYGMPLEATVTVRQISDGVFTDLRPRHGGTTHYNIGRLAVVETAAGLTVMLTTRRAFPVSIVQLTHCGLSPGEFRFIVAKGVHAPVTGYAEACKSFLRVNTRGITSADLREFVYHNRRHPLFPFETPVGGARIVQGHESST
jgi:microcystin degradation protein MlrC